MMLVEEHILWMAQNEARACTRIVQCVERIADLALTADNQVISKVKLSILWRSDNQELSFSDLYICSAEEKEKETVFFFISLRSN